MVESSLNSSQEDQPGREASPGQVPSPQSQVDGPDEADDTSSSRDRADGSAFGSSGDEELRRLEQELAVAHDAALRAHAELENFRKRSLRELEEQRKYAGLSLMRELLPVLDNLDRAIQAAEQSENTTGLLEGVSMVAQHLHAVLDQHHCKRIEAKGSAFDPNVHEAIGQLHCSEVPVGSVAEITTEGYELHGRVVRPSQVFVSCGPADEQPTDSETE